MASNCNFIHSLMEVNALLGAIYTSTRNSAGGGGVFCFLLLQWYLKLAPNVEWSTD